MTRSTPLHLFFVAALSITALHAHDHDWQQKLDGYVTRCFPTSRIKAHCDDLSEPAWGIAERAELNIETTDPAGNIYFYGYLRGIEGPTCKTHLKRIRRLMKNSKQACITGWDEWRSKDGETISRWESFETAAGKASW